MLSLFCFHCCCFGFSLALCLFPLLLLLLLVFLLLVYCFNTLMDAIPYVHSGGGVVRGLWKQGGGGTVGDFEDYCFAQKRIQIIIQ